MRSLFSKTGLKRVSILTSAVYLFSNVAFAYKPQSNVWEERQNQKQVQLASLPATLNPAQLNNLSPSELKQHILNDIDLKPVNSQPQSSASPSTSASTFLSHFPAEAQKFITLRDSKNNNSPQTILILEDVHANLEAQTNLSQALKVLGDQEGRGQVLVGLEGASGAFIYDTYKTIPSPEIGTQVADSYLNDGAISGPAHAGYTHYAKGGQRGLHFWGVDDPALYRENVAAYRGVGSSKEAVGKKIKTFQENLDAQKKAVFNNKLFDFDAQVRAYRNGAVSFGAYLETLASLTNNTSLEVDSFIEAQNMENKLDFSRVDIERRQVLEKLVGKLSEEHLKALLTRSLQYQEGLLSFADYYQKLSSLLQENNISLKETPAFESYVRYVLLSDSINSEQLFLEAETLEKEAYQKLAQTKPEQDLAAKSNHLYLMAELQKFALTSHQWEAYQESKDLWSAELNMSHFEKFYEAAEGRNKALFQNLVDHSNSSFDNKLVLVAGGYHTKGLTALLDKAHMSYAVASPKLTKIDNDEGVSYLSIFDQEKTPLDQLFSGKKLFLSAVQSGAKPLVVDMINANSAQAMVVSASALAVDQGQWTPSWKNWVSKLLGQAIGATMKPVEKSIQFLRQGQPVLVAASQDGKQIQTTINDGRSMAAIAAAVMIPIVIAYVLIQIILASPLFGSMVIVGAVVNPQKAAKLWNFFTALVGHIWQGKVGQELFLPSSANSDENFVDIISLEQDLSGDNGQDSKQGALTYLKTTKLYELLHQAVNEGERLALSPILMDADIEPFVEKLINFEDINDDQIKKSLIRLDINLEERRKNVDTDDGQIQFVYDVVYRLIERVSLLTVESFESEMVYEQAEPLSPESLPYRKISEAIKRLAAKKSKSNSDDEYVEAKLALPEFDYGIEDETKEFNPHMFAQRIKRDWRDVYEMLKAAKGNGVVLKVTGQFRGFDGPGSSLDLPFFQKILTWLSYYFKKTKKKLGLFENTNGVINLDDIKSLLDKGEALSLEELPSTLTVASDMGVTLTFEMADEPGAIEYVAPDYGFPADEPNKVMVRTLPDILPKSRFDLLPAYVLGKIFGLRGIKITMEATAPIAKAGGMESSNVFSTAIIAVGSMLSGADLSQADIFALAVKLENDLLGNITGGQGHLNALFGGAHQHIWLSGLINDPLYKGHYGALSVPLMDDTQLDALSENVMLVQAGIKYDENGNKVVGRTADLTNRMWTELLRLEDPVASPLHQEKIKLTARYAEALKNEEYETVVKVMNRYVDIRNEITERWITLARDYHFADELGIDRAALPSYAQGFAERAFINKDKKIAEEFKEIRALGKNAPTLKLYTHGPIQLLIDKARKEGIAIFPLGAGGPGANLMAVSSKGQKHLRAFFEKNGLIDLTGQDEELNKIMKEGGEFSGYVPFKASSKPMQFEGFDQLINYDKAELGVNPLPPVPTVKIHKKNVSDVQNKDGSKFTVVHTHSLVLVLGILLYTMPYIIPAVVGVVGSWAAFKKINSWYRLNSINNIRSRIKKGQNADQVVKALYDLVPTRKIIGVPASKADRAPAVRMIQKFASSPTVEDEQRAQRAAAWTLAYLRAVKNKGGKSIQEITSEHKHEESETVVSHFFLNEVPSRILEDIDNLKVVLAQAKVDQDLDREHQVVVSIVGQFGTRGAERNLQALMRLTSIIDSQPSGLFITHIDNEGQEYELDSILSSSKSPAAQKIIDGTAEKPNLRVFSRVPARIRGNNNLSKIWTIFVNMGLGYQGFSFQSIGDILKAAEAAKVSA